VRFRGKWTIIYCEVNDRRLAYDELIDSRRGMAVERS
jgi:hypothetical protein